MNILIVPSGGRPEIENVADFPNLFNLSFYIALTVGVVAPQPHTQSPSQMQHNAGTTHATSGVNTTTTTNSAIGPNPNAEQYSIRSLLGLNATSTNSTIEQRTANTQNVVSNSASSPPDGPTRFPSHGPQIHGTSIANTHGHNITTNVTISQIVTTTQNASTLPIVTRGGQHPVSTTVAFSHRGNSGISSQPSVVTYGGSPITIQPIVSQIGVQNTNTTSTRAVSSASTQVSSVLSTQTSTQMCTQGNTDSNRQVPSASQHSTAQTDSNSTNMGSQPTRRISNSGTESDPPAATETQDVETIKKADELLYKWLRANILVS